MLIDVTQMGPERRFVIEASDVRQAVEFYRHGLDATETFRMTTELGEPSRVGLHIGPLGLTVAEVGSQPESMTLSRLAEELETPFVGLIVYVPNPAAAARRMIAAGGRMHPGTEQERPECGGCPVQIVIDPFGAVWAFARATSLST